jgi:5'-3' exonuclease
LQKLYSVKRTDRRAVVHESQSTPGRLGDIYAFRSAASAENDNLGIAVYRVEEMIDKTLNETSADEFSIFLSGDNNFRYEIYPEYKANRTQPKPRFLKEVKDYLIEKYKAEVSDGCEADDLLGIAQCTSKDTIICSLDKDLKMIPGMHYSFEIRGTSVLGKEWVRPMEIAEVTPEEALKRFYTQVLVGDSTDNIKGAAGIGPKKAEKIIAECSNEQEMVEAVKDHFSCDEEFLMTAQLVWIFREKNGRYQVPNFGA